MAADPLIGNTIGGCLIQEVIGQGGMGVIYKARQKSLDRVVALKVLAPHLANDINFVSRFQREARAIARVNHPNILAVYDVGDDQNTNYMIMELIDGQSLAELQSDRQGALPWREALSFIKQAAQGLEAAQAVGIIHRDIKPENLMVTKKGVIKVSDFGLAKEADASNTSVDAVMGTPAFMSPEQCDGKKVDARSDIYSLGGTFYRLITGRLPFEAETAMSMMYRHKHEALIPPHEVVPSLPPGISTIIVKMMAKKREHRQQTMTEVIDALDDAAKNAAAPAQPNRAPAASPPLFMPGQARQQESEAQLPPLPASSQAVSETGVLRRGDSVSGISLPPAASGRLPASGANLGFSPGSDSSSRMSMPSGMGLAASGMSPPDDAYTNVAKGDELMGRGDKLGALKCFRAALQFSTLDNATRARIEHEVRKEAQIRRTAAEGLMKKGLLIEASRECRVLVDLDPADDTGRAMLKDIDQKLSSKRALVNDIRTAMATSQFEKAIKFWDSTPAELRDDSLGKQIEQLRNTIVPSFKLAEQGESFSRQGRIEEAISTFEDALKINPGCEPARAGLKEAQQKVQRIEHMLKEGYQFSLEQNYEKAIETWKPILALRPGHPQAVKSMLDAHMAHSQHLRSQGDLDGAWAAHKGAFELDPNNKAVRKSYEELTHLRDKEQALTSRAQESAARNRLGEAIGYWKDVKRLNPASKKAAQQLAQLGRQRESGFLKLAALVVVVSVASVAGYQYLHEVRALDQLQSKIGGLHQTESLDDAYDLMQKERFNEAMSEMSAASFYMKKSDAKQLAVDGRFWLRIHEALAAERNGRLPEAEKQFVELAREVNQDRPLSEKLRARAIRCKMLRLSRSASDAVAAHDWRLVVECFSEMRAELQLGTAPDEIKKAYADPINKITFAQKMQNGERNEKENNKQEAYREYSAARRLQGDLKFPGLDEYLKERLSKVGFDESKYTEALARAKAAFLKNPPDYREAEAAYAEASGFNAEETRPKLQYVQDSALCDKDGMSLYAENNPVRGDSLWTTDRRAAYCIDRYEFPNKAGNIPAAGVTWVQADKSCRDAGKRLCVGNQWIDACRGGERFTELYPYGNAADADACNTGSAAVAPSGSKPKCKNAIGVYDMSGNLAEWVDGENADSASVMGGSYASAVGLAMCDQRETLKKSAKADPHHGFRCCRALPPIEPPPEAKK
jgi:serine/threonine protein kinase